MTERNAQPDPQSNGEPDSLPDPRLEAPVALADDLASLFGGQVDVSSLRQSMVEASRQHFAGVESNQHDELDPPQPIRAWWARWPITAGVGMAAAIGLVVWINAFAPMNDELPNSTGIAIAGDIDRNGKVDILDAYQLQRRIEQSRGDQTDAEPSLAGEWDMNGDGQVNRDDVAAIAMLAVKIEGGTRS